jgi:predicted ester cyclase
MSSEDENRALFQQLLNGWQTGDLSKVDTFVARNYVGHVSAGDRDIDGLKARVAEFNAKYPVAAFLIEDQLAIGEKVVTRMTAHVTDASTGNRITLMGINISRFSGGKLCEEWATWELAPG